MGNDNYSLGSKPNPIPWSSFIHDVNFHNWVHPAWVGTDANNKFLANSDGQEVNCTGAYNSPYAYTMYQQLSAADCWSGGWVNNNNVISYISSSGNNYPPIDDNIFGNEDYPIPESIYEEMCDNEIWEGGWVIDNNNIVDYIDEGITPNNGGSGSGSGSGSDEGSGNGNEGSGCGSGGDGNVISGSDNVMFTNGSGTIASVTISWSSGSTTGNVGNFMSEISASINYLQFNGRQASNICDFSYTASWSSAYSISISISAYGDGMGIAASNNYNVPEIYHGT